MEIKAIIHYDLDGIMSTARQISNEELSTFQV
jgi:hypothetical protein